MSGNETLLAPEPVVDIQTTAAMPEDAGYTYQRADGTVERAMSAEDAIARCPVLGKLAIEAPDQANILLELAAAGKEKIQAEEKQQKAQPEEKAKVEQKPEPKVEVARETKPVKPEPQQAQNSILKPEPSKPMLIDKQSEVFQAIQQQRQQDEKPLSVVPSALVAEKVIAVQQRTEQVTAAHQEVKVETQVVSVRDEQHIEQQRADAFIHYQQHVVSQEQPLVVKSENNKLPDLRSSTASAQEFLSEVSAAVYEDEMPATTDASPDAFRQAIDVLNAEAAISSQENVYDFGEITQDDEPEIDTLTLPLPEAAETDDIEAPVKQNIETDEQLALQFEPEVIDTYKELLVLLEHEISEPYEPNEIAIELDDKTDVLVAETIPLEDTALDFETFLALQPEAEEVVLLETIIEQAVEQSLEQTFVQLAQYLSDTLAENQDASEASADTVPELNDEHIELNAILQEITEILPTCYSVSEETQERRIQITPEMTQKLLMLLRSLGYEQPREVLVEFVRLHGLGFLLQAIQYMCQLNSTDNQQEFYSLTTTSTSSDDSVGFSSVLGNIVLRLLSVKTFATEY